MDDADLIRRVNLLEVAIQRHLAECGLRAEYVKMSLETLTEGIEKLAEAQEGASAEFTAERLVLTQKLGTIEKSIAVFKGKTVAIWIAVVGLISLAGIILQSIAIFRG